MDSIAEHKVLDHGILALVDFFGSDRTPSKVARTSFRNSDADKTPKEDAALSDHLIRNHHSTPIEFNQAIFYAKMPIFVARQWVRHRTASINEESMRYIEACDEIYVPKLEEFNPRAKNVKQGATEGETSNNPELCRTHWLTAIKTARETYDFMLKDGVAPEIARCVLPVAQYTAWHWSCDLRNISHFLYLRQDAHAQRHLRVYADAMYEQLCTIWPVLMEQLRNHVIEATTFSTDEMVVVNRALKTYNNELGGHLESELHEQGLSKRRVEEFTKKRHRAS